MERDWFQLVVFPMLHRLNGSFPLTYFDEINIHIASDIDLDFCRQLTTFAKESLWRFMKNLNSNRV